MAKQVLNTSGVLKSELSNKLNLSTDQGYHAYLLLTTIYAPKLVSLDCSFTLVLQGLNTQPYTYGRSR